MYEGLARSVLIDDDPAVGRAVERVRARHPELSESSLVQRLIERTALRCAAVGAAACAGGELLDRVVASADLSYQALSLNRLAASIARARRRDTTVLERGLAAGTSLIAAGAAQLLRRGVNRAADRPLRRAVPGLAPLVAAFAGGAAGYAAAKIFGLLTDDFLMGGGRRRRWAL